jgi:hypothetical protein
MGLFIVISTAVQIALGFIINALWNPQRTSIPWWDKAHWWFGRIIFLIAIVNIHLGIKEYGELGYGGSVDAVIISFWILVGLGVGLLIWGQFYFGQTHDMASSPKSGSKSDQKTQKKMSIQHFI